MQRLFYPLAISALALAANAQDEPAQLAAAAGCGACHQAEEPGLGPSWQAIAERYQDQEGAAVDLQDKMRAVSRGNWGEAPMPPVTPSQLTDDQLSVVIDWILSR
ncbi:MAG: c-type cytochrome [Chromatocurvus sp.]